ncbi:MAG TPA: M3 family oligoendopeptidase [Anaerolineaceae bacterium]|nr:M3 family oligoendopeptidase [Anaerolineaceae bacterium]
MKFRTPTPETLLKWKWQDFEPYFEDLLSVDLTQENISTWMAQWTQVSEASSELFERLYVATSVNTADEEAEQNLKDFMEKTYPQVMEKSQQLKEKLLESKLVPHGFDVPMRNMRAEAALFRKENIPLEVELNQLSVELDKILGAQTIQWEGEEQTARQMEVVFRDKDRARRAKGWELTRKRQLEDRQAIDENWVKMFKLRMQVAKNAGKPSFREYIWEDYKRFDYTPTDCLRFHDAIEEVVVPAVNRISEKRKKALGISDLRYYDLFVAVDDEPPLKPFTDAAELEEKASTIFHQVHPQFGEYFEIMRREGLLDLANRKNKADGAYTTDYSMIKRPFVFGNAVGIHDDVQTLVHEGGHAFHAFETFNLPYAQQRWTPMEFNEVASMAMEMLIMPYLTTDQGGFYSEKDAARAIISHLEDNLRFWPYMAIVDAFQHLAYENPQGGLDPRACDAKWGELEKRFRPHLNWSGYEDVMMTGWHRKHHIHQAPFYYIEYGLAQLGAGQVWLNALKDQSSAVEKYHHAMQLGGTVTLPQLYQAAGIKLAFDAETLGKVVATMEEKIAEMEAKL